MFEGDHKRVCASCIVFIAMTTTRVVVGLIHCRRTERHPRRHRLSVPLFEEEQKKEKKFAAGEVGASQNLSYMRLCDGNCYV